MNHLKDKFYGKDHFWRYLVVTLIVFVGANTIGAIPIFLAVIVKVITSGGNIQMNTVDFTDLSSVGISPNVSLVLMLFPFLVILVLFGIMLKVFHMRTISEAVNGTKRIRWNRMLVAFLLWTLIMAINYAIDYFLHPHNYTLQFDLWPFVALVFISLLLIPFQAAFEELFFRGYLAQGFGVWTRSRWIALIVPSVLFGLLHAFNPEVKTYGFWLMIPQYIYFGLFLGMIAILEDGIESSIGVHAANNIFLALFITFKSSALKTNAVFEQNVLVPSKEFITMIIMSVIIIAILSYKNNWKWKILGQQIEESV